MFTKRILPFILATLLSTFLVSCANDDLDAGALPPMVYVADTLYFTASPTSVSEVPESWDPIGKIEDTGTPRDWKPEKNYSANLSTFMGGEVYMNAEDPNLIYVEEPSAENPTYHLFETREEDE